MKFKTPELTFQLSPQMWLEITPNTHKLGDMAVKAKALTGGAKKG